MKYKVLGIAAVALFAASVLAEGMNIKPGLWEMTVQGAAFSAMQQQVAKMSPDERKEVEAKLAKDGIRMEDTGMVIRVCITPEQAKQEIVPVQQYGKCTTNTSPKVGNTVKMSYTCTEPPSSGEGEITFQSDTAYSMTMRAVYNEKNVDSQTSGLWLNTDCGKVKPMMLPAPAR